LAAALLINSQTFVSGGIHVHLTVSMASLAMYQSVAEMMGYNYVSISSEDEEKEAMYPSVAAIMGYGYSCAANKKVQKRVNEAALYESVAQIMLMQTNPTKASTWDSAALDRLLDTAPVVSSQRESPMCDSVAKLMFPSTELMFPSTDTQEDMAEEALERYRTIPCVYRQEATDMSDSVAELSTSDSEDSMMDYGTDTILLPFDLERDNWDSEDDYSELNRALILVGISMGSGCFFPSNGLTRTEVILEEGESKASTSICDDVTDKDAQEDDTVGQSEGEDMSQITESKAESAAVKERQEAGTSSYEKQVAYKQLPLYKEEKDGPEFNFGTTEIIKERLSILSVMDKYGKEHAGPDTMISVISKGAQRSPTSVRDIVMEMDLPCASMDISERASMQRSEKPEAPSITRVQDVNPETKQRLEVIPCPCNISSECSIL
jgi:hypothetical protein